MVVAVDYEMREGILFSFNKTLVFDDDNRLIHPKDYTGDITVVRNIAYDGLTKEDLVFEHGIQTGTRNRRKEPIRVKNNG